MKTFNKEDLITWSNRHKVKVGDNGYFANNITDLNKNIKTGRVYELTSISDNYNWCFTVGTFRYGFFLPVDAVKEDKTYRPLKSIRELYEVIFDLVENPETFKDTSDKYCTYGLIRDCVLHLKSKLNNCEYYTSISSIIKENGNVQICMSHTNYTNFSDLFEEFDIEINGEWKPFGVLENE